MKELLTFDDILIVPKFSTVESRRDVDLSYNGDSYPYVQLPIISANMDTVTEDKMAQAMLLNGAQACLHRFQSIEDNVKMFKNSICTRGTGESLNLPFVSIGLGKLELERAEALHKAGAYGFFIDVAHGASIGVVKQIKELYKLLKYDLSITVGNFATADSVKDFLEYVGTLVSGIKVGVGPGSLCSTRVQTGIGYPQLSAVMEISQALKNIKGLTIIADGGMKTPGDCAKALGAGAHMLMSGSFFAGTAEAPGEMVWKNLGGAYLNSLEYSSNVFNGHMIELPAFKKYRGSASKESYEVQGKEASWRTPEGESSYTPYKGPVKDVLQTLEGGLRSAFSYVGARTLKDFHGKVEFVRVSNNTVKENQPHGKNQ